HPRRDQERRVPDEAGGSSDHRQRQRRRRQGRRTTVGAPVHFITGKHIPRRTFLQGVGTTMALPFLDAMLPARASSRARAATLEKTRLVCIEEVHGLAGCNNWGASKFLYAPETTGRGFTIVPDNPLSTLDAYREYMTIVSNTDVRNAEAFS